MQYPMIGVSLHPVKDRDILEWIETLPHRKIAETIRIIIRDHIRQGNLEHKMIRETWEIAKRLDKRQWVPVEGYGELTSPVGKELLAEETIENLKELGT